MSKPDSKKPDNTRKATQTFKLLIGKPEFQREVVVLQKKWGVNVGNPNRDKNMQRFEVMRVVLPSKRTTKDREMNDYPTLMRCHKDLVDLMEKFKLDSQYWIVPLWEYVRTGKFNQESFSFNLVSLDSEPRVYFVIQPVTKKRKVVIELGDDTTLRDVKAAWHEVEELRKKLRIAKPKFKEQKNLDRDGKVYALYEQGKTIAEISSQIFEEDGVDLDYGNIKKIVSTYRKKFGLPRGGKLVTSRTKTNNRVSKVRLR